MSAHAHPHPHTDTENPWAGQGAVLLDIGEEIGALVVEMPPSMVGEEVEVRRVGGPSLDHLPHVGVVDRSAGNTTGPSLVFGELVEGTYELFPKGGGPLRLTVDVRGGAVTEVTWG